ncbi:MAG: ADP-forming succinate--CoA ligase subunit beta [Halobacteriales archaeon]|nr:ADP-forming succinate--CoA ligase subunit beta [Halobacteriales archaeon]
MRLHEYQAKQVFADAGIPTPDGEIVSSPDEAREAAESLGCPVAVKAQVHVGGRGKAGGIEVVSSPEEARDAAERIIGMDIKGKHVEKVLVEKGVDFENELYVGVTTDRGEGRAVAMVSSEGGVNIEEVAEQNPDAIARTHVDPAYDLQPFEAREVVYGANVPREQARDVAGVLSTLYELWDESDADDAEINPLMVTADGDVIAADAVFNIDNSALYRQEKLAEMEDEAFDDEFEARASEAGFDYVRLNGNVGIVGNGAGLVMTTLDLVDHFGGSPANFLDIGGGADAERVRSALELVFEDENVDAVLFNVFGGITRCDEVAQGINDALDAFDELPEPLVVRLTGTNEEEGREILTDRVETAEGLEEAVRRAVDLSGGDS